MVHMGSSESKGLYTTDTQKGIFLKTRMKHEEVLQWKRTLLNRKKSHKSLSHASHMWNTCLGYFSHSSGNPLTCGSSISFESIFSTAPFSKGPEEPEIICLTRLWFKSTWKSAEIFLPSLTSYSATLTKKGSTWRKYQKQNTVITERMGVKSYLSMGFCNQKKKRK